MKYLRRLLIVVFVLQTVVAWGWMLVAVFTDIQVVWDLAGLLVVLWFFLGIPELVIILWNQPRYATPMDVPRRKRVYDMSRNWDE